MENYCDKTIPKFLVGNKHDNNNEINKVISTRDVCEYAEQNHLTFFETSVKDNNFNDFYVYVKCEFFIFLFD